MATSQELLLVVSCPALRCTEGLWPELADSQLVLVRDDVLLVHWVVIPLACFSLQQSEGVQHMNMTNDHHSNFELVIFLNKKQKEQ